MHERLSSSVGTYVYDPVHMSLQGNGRFSSVWVGVEEGSGQTVIIKRYNTNRHHPFLLRQFILEGKFRSGHPNVCGCIDLFREGDDLFMVKPYAEGSDLKTILKKPLRKKQRKALAIVVLKDVLDALIYLHEKGILHRDIKPSNILLSEESGTMRAIVLDLGMARFPSTQYDPSYKTPFSMIYSPPEQALNMDECVNASSDLFSLAMVLLEIFTGNHPYPANHPSAILNMQLGMEVQIPAVVPPDWREVLRKCLMKPDFKIPPNKIPKEDLNQLINKSLQRRFQSAKDLRNTIDLCGNP